MACKYAKRTDEYHGWECTITEGACMFLLPDQDTCAEQYSYTELYSVRHRTGRRITWHIYLSLPDTAQEIQEP